MINLARETLDILKEHGKTIKDIRWVGGCLWNKREYPDMYWESPDDFFIKAARTNYNNGYGEVELDPQLVVVGDDWWLEREDYDGREWWEFKTMPKKEDYEVNHGEKMDEVDDECTCKGNEDAEVVCGLSV